MEESNYYEYRVQYVGDYWDFNVRVQVELSEDEGNLSDEARMKAIAEANDEEWIKNIYNLSHEINITLLLDDEDVEL